MCSNACAMSVALTCLGTGDAFGSLGRHCAGYLVDAPDAHVLLDAGPSILSALKARDRATSELDGVLVSHLHGDHFGGIAFLFLEYRWEEPRTRPLVIAGPPGIESRVFELFRALYAETAGDPLPFPVEFIELLDGGSREVAGMRVESFRVPHQEKALSLGFRIATGDRMLVYSGDSAWTPDLLRSSSGADLFLCECSTFTREVPGHVRYRDIEENRTRFECRELLLTHLGRAVRERQSQIPERLADDGLVVRL
jgi:ribonuclease BN (tRNA processing enzyme)